MKHSSFIIAAPTSDSGKSTVTIGLLRALSRRGLKVQPFKCGPDYIDPKLHQNACHRDSINLDLFMQGEKSIKRMYDNFRWGTDVSIVEGVMGLFDGYDRDKGSTAQISKALQLPIVLVVTPKSMAYSVAPLLYGIKNFDPQLSIKGVIFNKVNSQKHRSHLQSACDDVGIEVLGFIPTDKELVIPNRHLGLVTDDAERIEQHANKAADLVEKHVDIEQLLESTNQVVAAAPTPVKSIDTLRIAVARDEAFSFIYSENIRQLSRFGIITYFSPIHDAHLPESDFVYLPGGYPENHLPQLSENKTMLKEIKEYAQSERPLLAECGGMLYLGRQIINGTGKEYPLVGLFQYDSTLQEAKLTIGYRKIVLGGKEFRGHEFHYSHLVNDQEGIQCQTGATGEPVSTKIFIYKNTFATYTHLLFTPDLLNRLIYHKNSRE